MPKNQKTKGKPRKDRVLEPTPKQRELAVRMLSNVGSGKSKGEIFKEAGYAHGMCKNPKKILESVGYKIAAKDLIGELEKLRKLAINELKVKDLKNISYRDLIYGFDKITTAVQLLQGEPTENNNLIIKWEEQEK